ncbi:MAG: 3-hydroxyacyl-CoA dehydrogenase NAD-binding domain-containing protein [Gemmatimonadota bacterium]|nr:3-hydroxyacyl-CoA dehydrogenase NAD-binding domain-containing protein [Gemmatimonadota bacterium]
MSAFTTTTTGTGIAVLTFDLPGEPVNKFSIATGRAFESALTALRDDPAVKAVVFTSGKPDTFIAGADIEEFVRLKTADEATALTRDAQELVNRLAAFPKPVVVAIHGACVGLGLELSLACTWRVATDHARTLLGLPEVQIGILPGATGCQRLPRLIGLRAALDIILAGKSERAAKAFRLGLVDELVPPSILLDTAIKAAERIVREGPPRRKSKTGVVGLLLDRNPLGRQIVYRSARATVLKKTGGHYPAPLAALEAVRTGLERGMAAGLRVEHEKFGELAVGEVSRQLVRIFFATTALKKDDGVPPGAGHARTVNRLGVLGAGFMGAGIAGTAVSTAGVEARLKDADLPRVGRGIKAATGILLGRLKRRRISKYEFDRLSALVSGGIDFAGFGSADLVIEAVFEDLAVKQQVLAECEAVLRPEALFATNTSTIPIGSIAALARHPERVLGMHFFSPVDRMPLLEVIPTEQTSAGAIMTAVQFGRRMGKTVIVVLDSPGFWVNRILSPYMNEAGILMQEGVPMEVLDRIMTRWGFPVGPATLLDEVGIDVAQKAGGVMFQNFGERLTPSPLVAKLAAGGRLGRKVGKGLYRYIDGKKTAPDPGAYAVAGITPLAQVDELAVEERLVYSMLNEAAMAMGEGVVRQPRDGDIGAIFGIGYPPFRGGPLRTIDTLGAAAVVDTLKRLAAQFGTRFLPAEALVEMAASGGRYYPAEV